MNRPTIPLLVATAMTGCAKLGGLARELLKKSPFPLLMAN